MMKKVLIFGCGSIGQKHIAALKRIKSVSLGALRTKKGFYQEIGLKDVKEFYSERAAFDWRPEYMIISNPTSLHLGCLLKGIKRGIKNIFIEKPLAGDYNDVKKVSKQLKNYKGNIAIGFNLRFHPVFKKIKGLIGSKKYGRVLRASLEAGSYLPFWHPYEDYKKSYSALKRLGGGALRTLCHEIDLVQYLFGGFRYIYGDIGRISKLKIDTDDNAFILIDTDTNAKIDIKLDYLRPIPERKGEVLFENGLLRYSLNHPSIEYTGYNTRKWNKIFSCKAYNHDTQYQIQMKDFINQDYGTLCTLKEGINVMKAIHLAESSHKKRKYYV
ncbi:MAG: Gfo/Idh/MocA family oxidoreductase [Candidatus Omnitrophica bacterium]|nr:Gfo/Idh/MocA family oxidoreductase [Candidatus Omnitrophota bacterium]MDD5429925.1 Gfo/Idh/MocA family oxidoreductase [Candidatus Omnitrophota bacterium]